jgi:cytochrome c1
MDSFYTTSKEWIVSESKRIFNVDVCPTCHSQLVKAYNNLRTYNLNNMAKKEIVETSELKLKKEFEGSTYSNGKISVDLSAITPTEAKKLFSSEEIKTYFE